MGFIGAAKSGQSRRAAVSPRRSAVNHSIQPLFLTVSPLYRLAGPDGVDLVNTFGDKPATLTIGAGAGAGHLEAPDGPGPARVPSWTAAGDAFGPATRNWCSG